MITVRMDNCRTIWYKYWIKDITPNVWDVSVFLMLNMLAWCYKFLTAFINSTSMLVFLNAFESFTRGITVGNHFEAHKKEVRHQIYCYSSFYYLCDGKYALMWMFLFWIWFVPSLPYLSLLLLLLIIFTNLQLSKLVLPHK